MTELYLIAHKVRDEPAFDIATRCDDMGTESDPGPWWIIPTTGHRAYPYWECHIGFEHDMLYINQGMEAGVQFTIPECPQDWPDHYAPSAAPRGTGLISNLIERLGLLGPAKPVRRR